MRINKLVVVTLAGIFAFAAMPASAQTGPEFMQQAIEQFKAKNHKEAERLFGECIRVEPKNLECLYRRAIVRELYIGYGLALEDYNAALAIAPNNHILLTARGSLYDSLKRPDEGIADLTKAIQLKANHADAYYKRGNIYRDKGDAEKAIADYTQAVRFDPKKDLAYMFRAGLYEKKGDKAQAIADYTSAIAAKPDKGSYYTYRGQIYFKQGQADLAEADFKRAVELDPSQKSMIESTKTLARLSQVLQKAESKPKTPVEAASSAGTSHYMKKEWDPAIAQFTKAIELEPGNHWHYVYRSRSYEGKGDLINALTDMNKGISLIPAAQASSFLRERADLYFKQGKNALAMAEINKIIAAETKPDAYSLLLRGKIYSKMGNKAAARTDLQKAVELNQYLKEAQEELAKL